MLCCSGFPVPLHSLVQGCSIGYATERHWPSMGYCDCSYSLISSRWKRSPRLHLNSRKKRVPVNSESYPRALRKHEKALAPFCFLACNTSICCATANTKLSDRPRSLTKQRGKLVIPVRLVPIHCYPGCTFTQHSHGKIRLLCLCWPDLCALDQVRIGRVLQPQFGPLFCCCYAFLYASEITAALSRLRSTRI